MNKTAQELLEIREALGTYKQALGYKEMIIKDDKAKDHVLKAYNCIQRAIEQIVLAIDTVNHSVSYYNENKDG